MGALPAWPAEAIGLRAYLSLRPAQIGALQDWAEASDGVRADALLQRSWLERSEGASAFVLLEAMERSGLERGLRRALLVRALAGVDIREALVRALSERGAVGEDGTLEIWWADMREEILNQGD